jgi:hypothetical protein
MHSDSLQAKQRRRRFFVILSICLFIFGATIYQHLERHSYNQAVNDTEVLGDKISYGDYTLAIEALGGLAVKERVSRDGYARSNFSSGWGMVDGCDMRNRILQRDLADVVMDDDDCTVLAGVLEKDMFSGKRIEFERGPDTSGDIHIEHIVAVSDAWQKGAQELSYDERYAFFNDPLNLIAIDGPTNMEKGDKDASDWMPRPAYRCRYVARQIAIKKRYDLWLDYSEHRAMKQKLQTCPMQVLPIQEESKQ